jgi:hypothetical protein
MDISYHLFSLMYYMCKIDWNIKLLNLYVSIWDHEDTKATFVSLPEIAWNIKLLNLYVSIWDDEDTKATFVSFAWS